MYTYIPDWSHTSVNISQSYIYIFYSKPLLSSLKLVSPVQFRFLSQCCTFVIKAIFKYFLPEISMLLIKSNKHLKHTNILLCITFYPNLNSPAIIARSQEATIVHFSIQFAPNLRQHNYCQAKQLGQLIYGKISWPSPFVWMILWDSTKPFFIPFLYFTKTSVQNYYTEDRSRGCCGC